MARRPSLLCYNDLNGEEMAQILIERFADLLKDVPYFKPHLTLPRVRATITVQLVCEAEDPNAKPNLTINDDVTLTSVVDSSPLGQPPDNVRIEHGLKPTIQVQTFDAAGRKLSIADLHPDETTVPLVVQLSEPQNDRGTGVLIDRTGKGNSYSGIPTRSGATVVVQDPGPAGLDRTDGGSVNGRFSSYTKGGGNKSDLTFLNKDKRK